MIHALALLASTDGYPSHSSYRYGRTTSWKNHLTGNREHIAVWWMSATMDTSDLATVDFRSPV
jgi:hypothetical protein